MCSLSVKIWGQVTPDSSSPKVKPAVRGSVDGGVRGLCLAKAHDSVCEQCLSPLGRRESRQFPLPPRRRAGKNPSGRRPLNRLHRRARRQRVQPKFASDERSSYWHGAMRHFFPLRIAPPTRVSALATSRLAFAKRLQCELGMDCLRIHNFTWCFPAERQFSTPKPGEHREGGRGELFSVDKELHSHDGRHLTIEYTNRHSTQMPHAHCHVILALAHQLVNTIHNATPAFYIDQNRSVIAARR